MKGDFSLVFVSLAQERLTRKQKIILSFLGGGAQVTATSLANGLSRELRCSRSALWNNLHVLQKTGLVEMGNGLPVRLTDAGRLVEAGI